MYSQENFQCNCSSTLPNKQENISSFSYSQMAQASDHYIDFTIASMPFRKTTFSLDSVLWMPCFQKYLLDMAWGYETVYWTLDSKKKRGIRYFMADRYWYVWFITAVLSSKMIFSNLVWIPIPVRQQAHFLIAIGRKPRNDVPWNGTLSYMEFKVQLIEFLHRRMSPKYLNSYRLKIFISEENSFYHLRYILSSV